MSSTASQKLKRTHSKKLVDLIFIVPLSVLTLIWLLRRVQFEFNPCSETLIGMKIPEAGNGLTHSLDTVGKLFGLGMNPSPGVLEQIFHINTNVFHFLLIAFIPSLIFCHAALQ